MNTILALAFALGTTSSSQIVSAPTVPPSYQTAQVRRSLTPPVLNPVQRPRATGADEAKKWRLLGWRDENGNIDPNGYSRALRQISELNYRARFNQTAEVWNEVGPSNITGRTRAMLIHPTQPTRMWMAHVSGGIWYSSNGGTNWQPVSDKLPNLNVTCMVFHPTNPDIMFAGTGEGYWNLDAKVGGGILKSTDGGLTWAFITGTSGIGNVNKLAIHPTNANIMLAATQSGGIRRTTDGGATWNTVISGSIGYGVKFHPTDPTRLVASSYNGSTVSAYYSTDTGATFTLSNLTLPSFYDRIELAYAPSSPSTVYAHADGAVYRSLDGGQTFSLRTTGGNSQSGWYYNDIWVHPTNPDYLLLTGLTVSKSTDGGGFIQNIGEGYLLTEAPHPDVHFVYPHPQFNGTSNRTVFVCTDGGIHRADDIDAATTSTGWVRVTRDAGSMQLYGAAGDGATDFIVGGSQDNGTVILENRDQTGTLIFGGDGGYCAVSHLDPNFVYGEYIYLTLFRSRNKGPGSNWIYNGISEANSNQINFIAPFILDPNDDNVLLGGGRQLWRSGNAKANTVTWASVKPNIGSPISAIAVANGNSDIIYVGHNNGRIYKTINGTSATPTWTAVDDNASANPLPNRYVHRIVVDPADTNKIWVGLGGFNSNNLWVSGDGGTTWAAKTGLPSAPIRGIARHPSDPNVIHVGTEVGIVRSSNDGTTWTAPTAGPFNVAIDELVYLHNSTKLLAATHGRGAWILAPTTFSAFTGPSTLRNGANGTFTLTFDTPAGSKGRVVNLTANQAGITFPATVTIPPRATSTTFIGTGNLASGSRTIVLTAATEDGLSRTHSVNVTTDVLDRVIVNPANPIGGRAGTAGKVFFSVPTPAGGVVVNLSSSDSNLLAVPPTLTVGSNKTEQSFAVTTAQVTERTNVRIFATYLGVTKSYGFTLQPPVLTDFRVTPNPITTGSTTALSGRIDMILPAPAGGTVVNLVSSDPAITVPSTVTIPSGAMFVTFPMTHTQVASDRDVVFRATYGPSQIYSATRARCPRIVSAVLSQSSVQGGSGTTVNLTVTLDVNAPPGGYVVALSSSDRNAATLPDTITMPAGVRTVVVPVTHKAVTATRTTNLKASHRYAGSAQSTLTVNP
ncbi:MAG: hypothetical protein SFX74_04365 [Fimbriimonadaceae bacterium]|nr:hypothetical protein [Fimbriimonadaceae bacterium]